MIMISLTSLEALCARRGIQSNQELAGKAGMQQVTLSRILHGKHAATMNTIDKICGALECQPGDILQWVPDAKK
jgi:putative transcriptional regulator